MKKILTILALFVSAYTFAQTSATLNLKLSGDLFYSRAPGSDRSIRMTLMDKIPSVLLVASDNSVSNRLQKGQPFLNGKGKRSFLVAFPALFNFTTQGSNLVFSFGQQGAENNLDQSVVRLSYRNIPASPSRSINRQSLVFPVSFSEILTVPVSGTPVGEVSGKQFLLAEATSEKTVTIEIDREQQRGNVLVAIFSEKTGKLLATLNPKDPENASSQLSYTVNESVLIIPLIRPRSVASGNNETVIFEVGDPREVATVTVTEE